MKQYSSLLVFIALVGLVTWASSSFQPGPFYEALNKPSWTPPDYVFAPVWGVLYAMIAFAGWIVWRAQGFGPALGVWFLQLGLNAGWTWLMFGQKQITYALFDIALLLLAIALFIKLAWPVRRSAALLFVPYFVWVAFATALNFEIWRLNS